MRILLPDAVGILLSIFISISPLKSCFWQEAAVTNVFNKFIVIWKEGDRVLIRVQLPRTDLETWQIIWTQFFKKCYREIASTKSVILGNMVYGKSHQCWKQTEAK